MRRSTAKLPAPLWWRELVRERLAELGWTQGQLAGEVGISQPAVTQLLGARGEVSSRHVLAISDVLGLDAPPEARALAVIARLAKSNPAAIDRAVAYLESVANAEETLDRGERTERLGRKLGHRPKR